MNRHLLDQVAHPRASWQFRGAQTALDTDSTAVNGFANSLASFLLDVPQCRRTRPGQRDASPGRHSQEPSTRYIHDKWQVRPNITLDLGLAPRGLHAPGRVHAEGRPDDLQPRQQHGSRGRIRRSAREPWREDVLEELQPAHGHFLAAERFDCRPRGLRRERAAVAELVWSGLSHSANPAADGAERLRASRSAGDRYAGACRSCRFPTAVCSMRRRCARKVWPLCRSTATTGSCIHGTWPISAPCPAVSPPKWPTSAIAAKTFSRASTSMPATRSEPTRRAGRCEAKYGRTAASTSPFPSSRNTTRCR